MKGADDAERGLERLLNVLERLCVAIESLAELQAGQILSGEEEESGPSEPPSL